jgi:hypothetical protein
MPPALLAGSGEKLGTDPWISQPACCGLCRGPFFSGAVGSIQICTWTGVGSIRVVLVMFSPTGCTLIRIIATQI